MRPLRDQLQAGNDDPLHLLKGRVHEVEGRGQNCFALVQAARLAGPVFWIVLTHDRDRPMPAALPDGIAERLQFIEAKGETDMLWTVEEALRTRPVSLVIAAPKKPISLTAGRRLQLAAEAGDTTGLMLIQEGGGAMPPRPAGNVIRCRHLRTRLVIAGFLIRTKGEQLEPMM